MFLCWTVYKLKNESTVKRNISVRVFESIPEPRSPALLIPVKENIENIVGIGVAGNN